MDNNIVSLAERSDDGRLWTVADMLHEVTKNLPRLKKYNKAILLLLDDKNDNYKTKFYQAGMAKSQIVALLEISKAWFTMSLSEFGDGEE